MMTVSTDSGRTGLAVSGARAVTEEVLRGDGRGGGVKAMLFQSGLFAGLGFALLGLVTILVWAWIAGSPRLEMGLFTNVPDVIDPTQAGFRTALLGTLYAIGGVVLFIVPVGVGAAIYLEEYADRSRWHNRVVEVNIQNLAAVPSIVYGILGLAFIVRGPLSLGKVVAAGSFTLGLLVLPTVIITAREALRAVPDTIRQGSLALGATRWQTVRRQVLSVASPGILTGVILAVSRAAGEAAPLLLVGAVTFTRFNPQLLEGGYSVLPVMIYNYAKRPQEEFQTLAAAGVIVMLIVLLTLNSFAIWLRNRYENRLV